MVDRREVTPMRPWRSRFHAEMRETSPLTTIPYCSCRDTDLPDSSNVTPAQHLCAFWFEIAPATTKVDSCCDRGRIGPRGSLRFGNFMQPGATFSGRTAGSGGPAPLSLGDVSPLRNVDPDDQKPSIGTGQSMSLDRGNGRHDGHRTHVECRALYVLAR